MGRSPPRLDVEPERTLSGASFGAKSLIKSALVLTRNGKCLDGVMPQLETRVMRVPCAPDAGCDCFTRLRALESHGCPLPLIFVPEAVVPKGF
jgi:hypothetical protein